MAINASRYVVHTVRKETLTSVHCKCNNWMMAKDTISGYPWELDGNYSLRAVPIIYGFDVVSIPKYL
jgi:hypothetical protein